MLQAVPESELASLRANLMSEGRVWYAISQDGSVSRADDKLIEAAFEETLWGDRPTHVFVLGIPDDVTYDDIYSGHSDRTAFRKYEDGDRMFLLNFQDISLPGIRTDEADWYFR
jgi:hypothetical protein